LSGLEQIGSEFFLPKITDLVGPHTARQNKSVNTLEIWFPIPENINTFNREVQNKLSTGFIFYTTVICHTAPLLSCACGQLAKCALSL